MMHGGELELLTVREVADRVGVSTRTVGEWIRDGRLASYELGYRTTRVRDADLQQFLDERKRTNGNGS